MTFSKEQWLDLEDELSRPFGRVKLKCDGYEITAAVERTKMKLVVSIYINGFMKGKWLLDQDCDESRKFLRRVRKYLVNGKKRTELLIKSRKRGAHKEMREFYQGLLDRHSFYVLPYWPNPKAFFRHIRKTCAEIELMDDHN
ncbi:hypothetical protein SAMN05216302_102146 [Nitrosomonas aestuarii]|uniref:Uncharacterized protein n=1 Tax=Nitrosomonas aestuarii TaxID=52441 RepID=A0A1I4DJ51_9PROT|nr:hypothetical protein [Nitrosomonas aestuarii]SFK92800.1 hypothetical protein SAMN05216302_102146 [Nitrosomonas aestuarii]